MRATRNEILTRLLDAYERSRSYRRPAPWSRDVILRVDRTTFPAAFAADGREARTALKVAIDELESARALRVVRHRGPASADPRELRLGPDELTTAYSLAEGYQRLDQVIADFADHARGLREAPGAGSTPAWMLTFLDLIVAGMERSDPGCVGASRERLKRERHELHDALTAAVALARGKAGWERMVSAELFGDSKRLAVIRALVASLLSRSDPRWESAPEEDFDNLLESYGVRRRPGVIRCAGAAILVVNSSAYRLEDFAPSAHLPEAWAEALVAGAAERPTAVLTTIENEYPFLSYVEESGGPRALGERGELVVYTGGFPTPVLSESLARLASRSPDLAFRHWGDADLGGLRIWWHLRGRVARPVSMFRTTATWVHAEAAARGRPFPSGERAALERLLRDFRSRIALGPDIQQALELGTAVIASGRKVEQERF